MRLEYNNVRKVQSPSSAAGASAAFAHGSEQHRLRNYPIAYLQAGTGNFFTRKSLHYEESYASQSPEQTDAARLHLSWRSSEHSAERNQSLPSKLSLALCPMVLGLFRPTHPTYSNYTELYPIYPNIFIWPDTRTRRFVDCQSQQSPLQDREGAKAIDLRWWLWQLPKQLGIAGPRGRKSDWHSIAKSDFLERRRATVGYNRSVGKKHQNHSPEIKTNTAHGTQTNIKHHQDIGWLYLLEESRTKIAHPETLKQKQQKVPQNSMLILFLFHYSTVPSAIQTWPRLHVIDWYHLTRPWRGQS